MKRGIRPLCCLPLFKQTPWRGRDALTHRRLGRVLHLQRRLLWLLGCYANDLEEDLRPLLLEQLCHLVGSPHANLAARLTALGTMRSLVDDWAFKGEPLEREESR